MRARLLVVVICGVFGAASGAAAQTPASNKPRAPNRDRELIVGGVLAGPAPMGATEASLLGSNGTPSLTLFRTESRVASGFGPEVVLGFHWRRALWFEVAAGLIRANLRTRITDDFENAPEEVLDGPVTRLSAEGAITWLVRQRGNTSWFIRGSGGLMRESSSGLATAEQGFIGGGGIGLRHWWRTTGKGTFKRIGLRAEFRGVLRVGGISLGPRAWTLGPTGVVHLVFGY